jgi:hypothetical protein
VGSSMVHHLFWCGVEFPFSLFIYIINYVEGSVGWGYPLFFLHYLYIFFKFKILFSIFSFFKRVFFFLVGVFFHNLFPF